jgi:guanylate kinase
MNRSEPLLIVISAPSGGGKTTLCKQLLAARPGVTRAITCTTRPPRPGERDGVDYYFLDETTFARRLQADEFIEHATVYGYRYGVLKAELLGKLNQGNDVLLQVDVQGAATIRAKARLEPQLNRAIVTVFLTPPTLAELERRLRTRGQDTLEVIQRRLGVARAEIACWREFDYLLISASPEEDLRRVLAIIEAEKMRTSRAQPPEF